MVLMKIRGLFMLIIALLLVSCASPYVGVVKGTPQSKYVSVHQPKYYYIATVYLPGEKYEFGEMRKRDIYVRPGRTRVALGAFQSRQRIFLNFSANGGEHVNFKRDILFINGIDAFVARTDNISAIKMLSGATPSVRKMYLRFIHGPHNKYFDKTNAEKVLKRIFGYANIELVTTDSSDLPVLEIDMNTIAFSNTYHSGATGRNRVLYSGAEVFGHYEIRFPDGAKTKEYFGGKVRTPYNVLGSINEYEKPENAPFGRALMMQEGLTDRLFRILVNAFGKKVAIKAKKDPDPAIVMTAKEILGK